MKIKLLATTILLAVGAAGVAAASEPLMSPHDKANQDQVLHAQARALGGRGDRSTIVVSSRSVKRLASEYRVRGTGRILTSYHGPANQPARSPRAAEQFQVAPLK